MVIKVFVSGCYDILHAGHIEFFKEARAVGENFNGRKQGEKVELIVSFASDDVLKKYKNRTSALPDEHKKVVLESIRYIDKVYSSTNPDNVLIDFQDAFLQEKPNFLVVTADDKCSSEKKLLCEKVGAKYVVLPKTPPKFEPISTTQIRERILK
jgi:cytidyltransferase-like protein